MNVVRNHNYTITAIDSRGRSLVFRDITGEDLEFLDRILSPEGDEEKDKQIRITYDSVVNIMNYIVVGNKDFNKLPRSVVEELFTTINEHILCNYMPKISWLKACYGMQNGSFAGISDMERVPMTKFVAMANIHGEAIESLKKDQG